MASTLQNEASNMIGMKKFEFSENFCCVLHKSEFFDIFKNSGSCDHHKKMKKNRIFCELIFIKTEKMKK